MDAEREKQIADCMHLWSEPSKGTLGYGVSCRKCGVIRGVGRTIEETNDDIKWDIEQRKKRGEL